MLLQDPAQFSTACSALLAFHQSAIRDGQGEHLVFLGEGTSGEVRTSIGPTNTRLFLVVQEVIFLCGQNKYSAISRGPRLFWLSNCSERSDGQFCGQKSRTPSKNLVKSPIMCFVSIQKNVKTNRISSALVFLFPGKFSIYTVPVHNWLDSSLIECPYATQATGVRFSAETCLSRSLY